MPEKKENTEAGRGCRTQMPRPMRDRETKTSA